MSNTYVSTCKNCGNLFVGMNISDKLCGTCRGVFTVQKTRRVRGLETPATTTPPEPLGELAILRRQITDALNDATEANMALAKAQADNARLTALLKRVVDGAGETDDYYWFKYELYNAIMQALGGGDNE
jgi:hypothetical protein